MFEVNASKSPEEIREKLGKIFNRLEEIEKDQRKKIRDLRESFRDQVNSAVHQLLQHLMTRFTNWSKEEASDEDGCRTEVEENVNAAFSKRFSEIVDQWEEENKVFSTTRTFLMEQFQDYLNNVEFKLQNVQSEAADDGSSNLNKVAFRIQLSSWQKQLKPFVEDQLKDVRLCLDRIEARLQELIKADRELYEQLSKRSARYQPLFHEAKQHRDQLAKFGLSEVCAVKIDLEELEWKKETSSCVGRGAFGAVYQGTMKRDGEVKIVALKVWNEALDAANAKEIMEEIKNLR